MSFLEMLDVVNERLIAAGEPPIVFDSDCREGICGMCSLVINGVPHGPDRGSTVCQLHMRKFKDGDTITVEPWRAAAFPVQRDLVVRPRRLRPARSRRAATSRSTRAARPTAMPSPIPKDLAEAAMDAAACIGCGACVAACKNASASLFVGAKVSQLALLPQGHPERASRVRAMVQTMDASGSATARTRPSARRSARRKSRFPTSRGCAGSTSGRSSRGRAGNADSRRPNSLGPKGQLGLDSPVNNPVDWSERVA